MLPGQLCDRCHADAARVHLTQIVEMDVIHQVLCAPCAEAMGLDLRMADRLVAPPEPPRAPPSELPSELPDG